METDRIRAALAAGVAAWREETDPDPAERYARTAAKLESLLREVSDPDDDGDRFELAEALYCISGDFKDPIRFRPSPLGNGPDGDGARRIYRHFRARWKRDPGRATDFAERAAVVLAILCADDAEGGAA